MKSSSSKFVEIANLRVAKYEKSRPDVVTLAMLTSLARKVEPELLRALRINFSHYFDERNRPDVGTEAALWFSSLVESRGSTNITLLPDVLEILWGKLKQETKLCKGKSLIEEVRSVILEFHQKTSSIISWEEDLIYFGLSSYFNEEERAEAIYKASLKAAKTVKNLERHKLAELIIDISRRVPESVRNNESFTRLLTLSVEKSPRKKDSVENQFKIGKVRLRIKRGRNYLEIGKKIENADFEINIPNITPYSIYTSFSQKGKKHSFIPDEGAIKLSLPARQNQLFIHSLDGNVYKIDFPNLHRDEFHFDIFLSYCSRDRDVVCRLAEKLRADGVRVWFDEWIIQPGDAIGIKINEGLRDSRVLVLAISANASESDWVTFEHQSILFNDPTNKTRRFIPLRLDDSEIQFALRQFAYIEWRTEDETQYERLLKVLRGDIETQKMHVEDGEGQKVEAVRIFKGHKSIVNSVTISSDNKLIVSGSSDSTVRIWETQSGRGINVLKGHSNFVSSVAISADGRFIVSGSSDSTVRIWETQSGKGINVLKGHSNFVSSVAISADGRFIVSGSSDSTVRIWETATGNCFKVLEGHSDDVWGVAISADGRFIVSGSSDSTVRIWETQSGRGINVLKGHSNFVSSVAISADGRFIVSGSSDSTVRIWETATGNCFKVLEGHSDDVWGVAISADGRFIVSGSSDSTVRIWETQSGRGINVLKGHSNFVSSVAISADGRFIVSGSVDETLRVWGIASETENFEQTDAQTADNVDKKYDFYTNAKVLIVGDSGVGKSGLAHRLTQNEFIETVSTDGVWATQMRLPHDSNTADTEREIWLWDFAGQSDYRLIHQLFMDETSLAVLVFNPQADNPFEGLGQWDRDLQRAARRPFRKLLVAGRCDRGSLTVSRKSLDDFKDERGFAKYLETSALTGNGCQDLKQAIIEHINWDEIPYRSSPRIFKLLKEEIIKLKDEGRVLLTLSELKQNLELRLSNEEFTFDEFKTVVGLLAGSGVVWQLEFGDFVLLQPERVNSYAAAVVRSVRAHVDEIGCIAEEKVLKGELDYQDMKRLPSKEEEIVLRAMHQTFIERGLCLRENTDAGVLLIFPSYFRRERPKLEKHPFALVTYQFSGMLDEIYATLVVKLHHTSAFDKDQLWRYAADFKTQGGKRVGLKMTKKPEGAAEITIYFEKDIPDDTKAVFIRYVHDHLKAKDENVVRVRHYVCPYCSEPFENERAIKIRLEKNLKDITCPVCDEKFDLWDLIEEKFASEELQQRVRRMEEESKIAIDNESREIILVGHAYAIARQAGQVFKQSSNSDLGIDGEIEFKDYEGKASGKRVYLQLKSGDSYLRTRNRDEKEIFDVKPHHAEYWQNHNYDVMLVIRNSNDEIRWMNVTEYLKKYGKDTKQIIFDGEPFTATNLIRLRDKLIPLPQVIRE